MGALARDPIQPHAWHSGALDGSDGASVEFLGIVRGEEDGKPIRGLAYEAYEPMAERLIARAVEQARGRWRVGAIVVQHRLGLVGVGAIALLVSVQAPHRDEAFEACRFLVEAIKRDVPIWKHAVFDAVTLTEAL